MRTLLTIEQQNAWLSANHQYAHISHKWSCNGYGNSKILDSRGAVIGKASGCGYDRYGTALGEAICAMFPEEIAKLAKRECKGARNELRKGSRKYYGLFLSKSKERGAYVDGGCGYNCMTKILNKIGFSLEQVGSAERGNLGEVFYVIKPLTKHERQYH